MLSRGTAGRRALSESDVVEPNNVGGDIRMNNRERLTILIIVAALTPTHPLTIVLIPHNSNFVKKALLYCK